MKIRTDPNSVVTDAVRMTVATMEHVHAVSTDDRELLSTALNTFANDDSQSSDTVIHDLLEFAQGVLTTPYESRSISTIITLLAAGNLIIDPTDPLTKFLMAVTDVPTKGNATWQRLDTQLDADFMARFTSEWWQLADNMLDAIYLAVLEQTEESITPMSMLMLGALPPMMEALYEHGAPEFGEFPGELLLTMFSDVVAERFLDALPDMPLSLREWADEHHTYKTDN